MAKITLVSDKSQVAPEHASIFDAVLEVFGSIRGPNSVMLYDPPLAKLSLDLGNFFRYNSVVKSPIKELAILTGTREKDSLRLGSPGRRRPPRRPARGSDRSRQGTARRPLGPV